MPPNFPVQPRQLQRLAEIEGMARRIYLKGKSKEHGLLAQMQVCSTFGLVFNKTPIRTAFPFASKGREE